MTIFGIPSAALFGQLLVGLINGSFYALLSMGIAIIFGLLRIANFVHGAQYMMGAFVAYFLLNLPTLFPNSGLPSIGYWWALLLAPILVGLVSMVIEFVFIRRIYDLDHAYGLLLTIGLTYVIEGIFRLNYGTSGLPYQIPRSLAGGYNLGFMFLPTYRAWVVVASLVICGVSWFVIERTRLGSYLRAATENPTVVQAFGVNVPVMLMLTYGFGAGLAALGGVLAAPIYQVSPLMGQQIIIVIFAVVVIGGMGSISGAILTGFALGILEGITKVFWPEASNTVIFIAMAIILFVRPAGMFGKTT